MSSSDTSANRHPGTGRRRATLVLAMLMFLGGGLAYSVFVQGAAIAYPDEADYLAIARHLLAGEGYTLDGHTPSADRSPGYPVALLPMLAVHDATHTVRALQCALLVLAVGGLAALPRATGLDGVRHRDHLLIAGLCAYPVLIYTAGTLFPQTLVAVLLAGIVFALFGSRRAVGPARAALAGLLCGWCSLAHATSLVIVPLAGLEIARHGRRGALCGFLIALALLPGAWTARNLIVLGEPIVFSRSLALNLDNAVVAAARPDAATLKAREPDGAIGYGVERLGQLWHDPGAYLAKLVGFFAWRNDLATRGEQSPLRDAVMFLSYHMLLLLAALRLLQWRASPLTRAECFIVVLYLATALFHALVFTRIRYRLPFDLLLLLPAGNALLLMLARRYRCASGDRTPVSPDTH